MGQAPLTLHQVIREDRLGEFSAQKEARGVGAAELREIEKLFEAAAKPSQSEGRTSRSASAGGSGGKRTPLGTCPRAWR